MDKKRRELDTMYKKKQELDIINKKKQNLNILSKKINNLETQLVKEKIFLEKMMDNKKEYMNKGKINYEKNPTISLKGGEGIKNALNKPKKTVDKSINKQKELVKGLGIKKQTNFKKTIDNNINKKYKSSYLNLVMN